MRSILFLLSFLVSLVGFGQFTLNTTCVLQTGSTQTWTLNVGYTGATANQSVIGYVIGTDLPGVLNYSGITNSTTAVPTISKTISTASHYSESGTFITTSNPNGNWSAAITIPEAQMGGIFYVRAFARRNIGSLTTYSSTVHVVYNKNLPSINNGSIQPTSTLCENLTFNSFSSGFSNVITSNYGSSFNPLYLSLTAYKETVQNSGNFSLVDLASTINPTLTGVNIRYNYTTTVLDNTSTDGIDESALVSFNSAPYSSFQVKDGYTVELTNVYTPFVYISPKMKYVFESSKPSYYVYFTENNSSLPELPQNSTSFDALLSDQGGYAFLDFASIENQLQSIDLSPGESGFSYVISKSNCISSNYAAFDNVFIPTFRLHQPVLSDAGSLYTTGLCSTPQDPATVGDLEILVSKTSSGSTYNYKWKLFSGDGSSGLNDPISANTTLTANTTYYVRYQLLDGNNNPIIEEDIETGEPNFVYSDTYLEFVPNLLIEGSWTGAAGTILINGIQSYELSNPLNWCGGVPESPTIPNGVTVYIDGYQQFTNLTVECGGALIIKETGRVNITQVLYNGGLVKVINGGTIKYDTQIEGSCTTPPNNQYEVNLATNRYWYIGPATNNAIRSNFGELATPGQAGSGTQMWSWKENVNAPSQGGYTLPEYSAVGSNYYFKPGYGYVYYNYLTYNPSTPQNVITNGNFNDSLFTINNLTRTAPGTSSSLFGYHLLSNPYPSYLDAEKFFEGSVNLLPTLWYRTTAQSSPVSAMTFDTYNVAAGVAVNGSGSNGSPWYGVGSSSDSVARFIPPMQGFWVRVASTSGGSALFNPATMTVCNPSNFGTLRSSNPPLTTLVKLSAKFGQQTDQIAVGLGPNAQNGFDNFDSEKMFTSGYVQIYTPNSGKKLAINSLKNNKAKTSVPITLECPSSGWYSINTDQITIDNGTVLLEDKLNNNLYDLSIDSTVSFFSNSGVISNRFVLHFIRPLMTSNPVGPSSIEDLVSETLQSEIDLSATSSGKVTVNISNVEEDTQSLIRVFDVNGKLLESINTSGVNFEIQLSQGQGVYLLEVTNGTTCEKKKLFIQ